MSTVLGIAYVRMFGPRMKKTPEGHPIQVSSVPFDLSQKTPVEAIKEAARRWHGIVQSPDADWELIAEYNVVVPAHRTAPSYQKVFYFAYKPEQALLEHMGLTGKVVNWHDSAWYLQRTQN